MSAAGFESCTLNMVGGQGYHSTLCRYSPAQNAIFVRMTTEAECWVTIPANGSVNGIPTASVIPSAGAYSDYVHLLPGSIYEKGIDVDFSSSTRSPRPQDLLSNLYVYAVNSGMFMWEVHLF